MSARNCGDWHVDFHLRAIGAAKQFVMLSHETMTALWEIIEDARLIRPVACYQLWRRHWLTGQWFEFWQFHRWHKARVDDNLLALLLSGTL